MVTPVPPITGMTTSSKLKFHILAFDLHLAKDKAQHGPSLDYRLREVQRLLLLLSRQCKYEKLK